MNGRNYKLVARFVLVTSMAVTGCLHAQDVNDQESAKEQEQVEAASDLRQSVHENLDSLHDDAEKVTDLGQEAQAEQAAAPRDVVMGTTSVDAKLPFEELPLYDLVREFPYKLQSLPERLPGMRGKGFIFFGRAEADYAHYTSGAASHDSGFLVRSLRAGLARAFSEYDLSAKAEIDFTDGDSNWSDLYVRYHHDRWGLLTVGNQRVAQTLVNQTSRISQTFMEEPLPAEAFGLHRRLALGWDQHRTGAGMHLTLFGNDLNGSLDGSGYAGRVYFNPTHTRFSLFHVGTSFVSEKMSRNTRYFAHPESRVTNERFVDTGIYKDVGRQTIAAFEMAGARESFMIRGEYYRATWDRNAAKDPVFRGFYFQSSWVLTGEHFNYVNGKFVRIRPQNPRGAWEVAVRYSFLDLNDKGVTGGKERNFTVGLNWYSPGNQFRLMSNLIFVETDENAGNEDPIIFQLRAQLHW